MIDDVIFKTKLDGKAKWMYKPFLLLIPLLMVGAWIFLLKFAKRPINPQVFKLWKYSIVSCTIWELIFLKYFIKHEKVEILKNNNNHTLRIRDKNILIESIDINKVDYWWNYNFGQGPAPISPLVAFWGINSSTTDRSSKGTANGINIYVKITNRSGKEIILCETLGNWASTPHWKYKLEDKRDFESYFDCLNLQKMVKLLG